LPPRLQAVTVGAVRYRFGEFELDATAYTLKRAGRELALQPKVFDLLHYLVEHRGRVVTKAELLDSIWAGEHVNEGAVPWSVSHARRALGQDRGDKSPIETVQRRGYRLNADVEVISAPATAPPSSIPPAQPLHVSTELVPSALPFVGRSDVMNQLEGRLAQALAGEGGLCLLVGESGIGKTRCAEELRMSAARNGVRMWSGRSVEGLGAPVFWPWIQVLREAMRERPELRESAEALLSRMEVFGTTQAGDPVLAAGNEGGERFWVLDGVSRFLLEAAQHARVMVLLEDLHWADSATIELLSFLAPELRRSRLLVVGTLRPDMLDHDQRRAGRLLRNAERIDLRQLTPDDVGRYITELTHHAPGAELCRAVHRATAGNPLFLQETLRTLIAEHGDENLGTLEPATIAPSSIARDVLRARLSALPPELLSVLSSASVLGESFELAILQRLLGVTLEQLLETLEHAVRTGLVAADGPHRYRFAHALLRSILYDDMPGAERVGAHRRAAELLSELSGATGRHSEIAYHYYRSLPAGGYDKVVAAATHAAEAAARMQAFEDAVEFYAWALEAQALDPTTTPLQRAELLFAQGSTQRFAGRFEVSRRTLSVVIEIARQHGYADLLLRAARALRPTHAMGAVPDPLVRSALEEVLRLAPEDALPLRIGALSQLACIPPHSLDMRRSGELSEQALVLARRLGNRLRLFEALRARLHALSGPDHIDDLLEVASEMLALDSDRTWMSWEAHAARVGALIHRGDIAGADATLHLLGRVAREVRMPEGVWFHDRIVAQRQMLDGEFEAAERSFKDLRQRARRIGLGYGPAFVDVLASWVSISKQGPVEASRGWNVPAMLNAGGEVITSYRAALLVLAVELGLRDVARRTLDAMVSRDLEDLPKDVGYLNALSNLGKAVVGIGDHARAKRIYELLSPYPHHNTPNTMLFYDGSVSHVLALLAGLLGHDAQAEAHFLDALAMNERIGARPHLVRTLDAYSRWLAEHRSASQAKEPARRAHALASGLGMGWLAQRTAALAGR